ncbi:DUF1302 domain-containing protein [Marinomonas sp. TW1]|uniref:DUF1302 domain-containing protein n=1 Tax=Marinomonas sp. TW1 TaxID=1561203 RepID=UPI0007AF47EE|nr:DUF1302 family protein [Marinomonas sp. TW1]KZN15334.1 hypothetical protein OA79_00660 [Marinomonas sp. TW1]
MKIINSTPFRLKVVALAIASSASSVYAFNIDTGNSDIRLSLDNTLKYSTAFRTKDRSAGLAGPGADTENLNDGDNNFDKGLVSNRLDLLTELDISYKDTYGARISAAGWYDDVYHQKNDNTTGASNHVGASDEFSDEAKDVMGGDVEILDAFVYGRFPVMDGMDGTIRVGRHSLLWGESLFFGGNGIAGGNGPVDVVKLAAVPNSTFKETMMPTGKVSVDIPISETASIGAYVGYEWEKSRLLPAGAYLSPGDTLGGETLHGGVGTFNKIDDIEASDSGQYGLKLSWSDYDIDTDFGLYATRYHATGPSNLINRVAFPGPTAADYRWVYAEGIEAYGFSMAKTVGRWSLAGEMSYRRNAPLASRTQTDAGTARTGHDDGNLAYAVGETAHAQFNWLANVPSFISQEASFLGEIAWNTRVKTTANEEKLNEYSDKSAVSMRVVYNATYRQVFDGLDLTPSIGASHTWGKSSAIGPAFGVDGGGDVNIGVKAVYLNKWKASLSYKAFYGEEGPLTLRRDVNGDGDEQSNGTYKQSLKDRNFISASVSTTF